MAAAAPAAGSLLRRVLRPLLTAQLSVAASMFIGDAGCQWIARHDRHHDDDTTTLQQQQLPAATTPSSSTTTSSSPAAFSTAASASSSYWQQASYADSPLPSVGFLSAYLPSWLDPQRSLVMLVNGFFVSGPWSAVTLSAAELLFPGRSPRSVLSKVAMNGLIAPIGISLAFTSITLLEGRSVQAARQKVSSDLGSTWLTGALYWPIVSALNFRFVPFEWRPLWSGAAGAVWGVYMSNQAHKQPALSTAARTPASHDNAVLTAPAQGAALPPSAMASSAAATR